MISETEAKIETHEHDFSRYDDKSDSVKMPAMETFRNPRNYYGHAVLQLSTWTGNEDRAPRTCFAVRKTGRARMEPRANALLNRIDERKLRTPSSLQLDGSPTPRAMEP